MENLKVSILNKAPVRIALPDAPAPTSKFLEKKYYFSKKEIIKQVKKILK